MSDDLMNDIRITRLKSPAECEQVAINVAKTDPQLALAAKRRAVEMRADAKGATTPAGREALQAVYAYEQALTLAKGKVSYASRTWQMINRHGIIEAMERLVKRPDDATGYQALKTLGMQDLAFEAVVLRHPDEFSEDAITMSRNRLANWADTGDS